MDADQSSGDPTASQPADQAWQPSVTDFIDPVTGQFLVHNFFDVLVRDSCPLFRFADDIPVDWRSIGEALGKDPRDCLLQMQYILDIVFRKTEFSEDDRRLLLLLHRHPLPGLAEQWKKGVSCTDLVVSYLQLTYFREYSLLTTAREEQLALLILRDKHMREIAETVEVE